MFYNNSWDYREEFKNYWNDNVKKVKRACIIIGIIMIVLGVLCVFFPVQSILVMEIFAASLLIAAGIYEIYNYAKRPVFLRFGGGIVAGILNIMLGILLLTLPAGAMVMTFAFIFAIAMMTFGIEEIAWANRMKFFGVDGTGWLTASGVINLVCAMVLILMPQFSAAVSYIVAVYLFVGGITLLIGASHAKELTIND